VEKTLFLTSLCRNNLTTAIYRLSISYGGQPKPAEGGPMTRFVQVPLDFISLNCNLTLDYSAMTKDQSIKQLMTIPSIGKSIAANLWNNTYN
jgi:hypothetical protein